MLDADGDTLALHARNKRSAQCGTNEWILSGQVFGVAAIPCDAMDLQTRSEHDVGALDTKLVADSHSHLSCEASIPGRS